MKFSMWCEVSPAVRECLPLALAKNTDYRSGDVEVMVRDGNATVVEFFGDGDTFCGFSLIQDVKTPAGVWLHDAHVWVLKEHRRHGIYGEYLAFLKGLAVSGGYLGVTMNTYADEPFWSQILEPKGFHPRVVTHEWRA